MAALTEREMRTVMNFVENSAEFQKSVKTIAAWAHQAVSEGRDKKEVMKRAARMADNLADSLIADVGEKGVRLLKPVAVDLVRGLVEDLLRKMSDADLMKQMARDRLRPLPRGTTLLGVLKRPGAPAEVQYIGIGKIGSDVTLAEILETAAPEMIEALGALMVHNPNSEQPLNTTLPGGIEIYGPMILFSAGADGKPASFPRRDALYYARTINQNYRNMMSSIDESDDDPDSSRSFGSN